MDFSIIANSVILGLTVVVIQISFELFKESLKFGKPGDKTQNKRLDY